MNPTVLEVNLHILYEVARESKSLENKNMRYSSYRTIFHWLFRGQKLDKDGYSLEPNELEKLSPETAEMLAKKTGSDIFLGGVPYSKTFALKIPIGKR